MADLSLRDTRGVLHTPPAEAFSLRRLPVGDALAPYATWHWSVSWDLRGREPHKQVTLPHPSAHLVIEDGAASLWGPPRHRFTRTLAGAGRTVGLRFRPGGIRPLVGAPVASIADRVLPASAIAGLDGEALARGVEAEEDLAAAVAVVERLIAPLLPREPDPAIALADRACALLAEDRSLRRVADLASSLGFSVRSVQRLFADHVGLGPAQVIRRYRLQEAAAAVTDGDDVDWARLALDLGYYDQAHLVRDFTAQVGTPPARYARESQGMPMRDGGQ